MDIPIVINLSLEFDHTLHLVNRYQLVYVVNSQELACIVRKNNRLCTHIIATNTTNYIEALSEVIKQIEQRMLYWFTVDCKMSDEPETIVLPKSDYKIDIHPYYLKDVYKEFTELYVKLLNFI